MDNQCKSKIDIVLSVISSYLNTSVQNIDVTKTFDESGGNSIILLSIIKELKKFNLKSSIELFEPPNTLQDILNYINEGNKVGQKSENNNLKIFRFADIQEKEILLDMCCRSFAEKNYLFSSYGIRARDVLSYLHSLAAEDLKHPLSLVVYDAAAKKYVGGVFLYNYATEDFVFSEKMHPVRDIITLLATPHELKEAKEDILYVSMCYAETDLPSTTHLETFHLLVKEIYETAKKNKYRAIVSITAHLVTEVGTTTIKCTSIYSYYSVCTTFLIIKFYA